MGYSDSSALISQLAGACLVQLPAFIAWTVGVVLAITNWRKHPRVSLFTVIALAIFATSALCGTGVSVPTTTSAMRGEIEVAQLGSLLLASNLAFALLNAVAWGFLLAAIFRWRD